MVKIFKMIRKNDTSGVSGTGHVLTGIIFDDGQTIVKWHSKTSSVGVWEKYEDFLSVHVTSHPENLTEIKIIFDSEIITINQQPHE